jgi:hypothetical protein
MWGRISRSHGNSGVVKTKFRTNLPAHAFGASCRVVSPLALECGCRGLTGNSATDALPLQHLNNPLMMLVLWIRLMDMGSGKNQVTGLTAVISL